MDQCFALGWFSQEFNFVPKKKNPWEGWSLTYDFGQMCKDGFIHVNLTSTSTNPN